MSTEYNTIRDALYNGPGFAGLYAGDIVEFTRPLPASLKHIIPGKQIFRGTVLPLLVFADHVQVKLRTPRVTFGYTVDASNFVRLVRRGKRHMAADAACPACRETGAYGFCPDAR